MFLSGCGYFGAAQHEFAPKAMHSLYAGTGAGAALAVCGLLAISGSYKLYMIGVHLALLLEALFLVVFGAQAFRSYGVPEKEDRLPLFTAMFTGTFVAILALRILKPKKKAA